ncbi:MAG: hypothetical protein QM279_08200 [Atribacterota bacterium]|nr:hypothetical protein [Atribacterota bacterium]
MTNWVNEIATSSNQKTIRLLTIIDLANGILTSSVKNTGFLRISN